MINMNDKKAFSTWLEIDLNAIKNNIQKLRLITNSPVMAVVKANAYGHGLEEVSITAEAAGASWCGVARLEEALALRDAGIKCRILVLGYTSPHPERLEEAIKNDISLTVYDEETAKQYVNYIDGIKTPNPLRVHVKFDSGMGRLGMLLENGVEFVRWLYSQHGIEVEGLFTHFARADEPEEITTSEQINRFNKLIEDLRLFSLRPPWVHAANSAGSLNNPEARYNLVRPGIAIYGLNPSPIAPLPPGFQPALTWKTRLISVKNLPSGHGISYGHRYVTEQPERIGIIAIGYADGFRRRNGNIALVHGKRVDVVGSVCMDQCAIKLDQVPEAQVGDEVVLIGSQQSEQITADEVADIWETINYEIVSGLAKRLPRIYLENHPK